MTALATNSSQSSVTSKGVAMSLGFAVLVVLLPFLICFWFASESFRRDKWFWGWLGLGVLLLSSLLTLGLFWGALSTLAATVFIIIYAIGVIAAALFVSFVVLALIGGSEH